jgi:glycerol-3-phosphate acyltransferase PlsX
MRIIVDAMGGDKAPEEIVKGAVEAAVEFGVNVTLTGREEEIRRCLKEQGELGSSALISVVNATEVISMEDDPSTATRRKKDSSMSVALNLLRDGEGDACVSAGSTGALLTGATLTVKRIRGVRRACLAPVLPNGGRGVMLLDGGANVECTAEYLLQFAYMGSFYSHRILGCASPRVGLLNIGTEETKGTELQKQAYSLLSQARDAGRLRFVGNTEARELFSGNVDVLVCDGFSGNILLKSAEGSVVFVLGLIRDALMSSTRTKLAAAMIKNDLKQLKKRLDVREVGGTALLGISKPVIKAHGSSDARAIRSAVSQAIRFIEAGVISEIERHIEYMSID